MSESRQVISRRTFLHSASIMTAGALLSACVTRQVDAPWGDPTLLDVTVPRPQTGTTAEQGEDDPQLAQFMVFSALVTGVSDLDPSLGRLYMQSVDANPEFSVTVAQLLERAGFAAGTGPTSLEELERTSIFEEDATRPVADKILEYWYTGMYDSREGEQVVATFVDSLAWKTLTFTKPMTVCGSYAFWTEPPESAID